MARVLFWQRKPSKKQIDSNLKFWGDPLEKKENTKTDKPVNNEK